jgi:hypothetical protein
MDLDEVVEATIQSENVAHDAGIYLAAPVSP